MSGLMYENSHWSSSLDVDNSEDYDDDASQHSAATSEASTVRDALRDPDIAQRVLHMYQSQKFADVRFVLSYGVKPKPIVLAHKAILAISCKEFEEMLYSNDQSKESMLDLQINNVPEDAFRNVIQFLYTDDIYFENDFVAMQTLSAASKFQVHGLVAKCESYFEMTEITDDSACSKLHLSTVHKMDNLKNRCTEYIQDNTAAVLGSSDFILGTPNVVRAICKLPKLSIPSELELFEAVVVWAQNQPDSIDKMRELVEPYLKHIRFLTLPCDVFSKAVERHGIFTAAEALGIVAYLANPSKNKSRLPTWCNKNETMRTIVQKEYRRRRYAHQVPLRNKGQHFRRPTRDQKITISLKPVRNNCVANLVCILELKCLHGSYQLRGLKLLFGDPMTAETCIRKVTVSVTCEPKNFTVSEHLTLEKTKEVLVYLSKNIQVRAGQKLRIRVEASGATKCHFLQFDEPNSFPEAGPFECGLGSIPKENKLFFINEVIYCDAPVLKKYPSNRGPLLRDRQDRPKPPFDAEDSWGS